MAHLGQSQVQPGTVHIPLNQLMDSYTMNHQPIRLVLLNAFTIVTTPISGVYLSKTDEIIKVSNSGGL